jgi:hypothetical protein
LALQSKKLDVCRNGFPNVVQILDQIVGNLQRVGSQEDVDVNNVTLRLAMDVTGLVGFAKDFGTTRTFSDTGTDELFTLIQRSGPLSCFNELIHHLNPTCRLLITCKALQ